MADRGTQTAGVILAEPEDATATWLAAGLAEHRLLAVVITPLQLCEAALELRLNGRDSSFRITLEDGHVLDRTNIGFVFNRMTSVPLSMVARSVPDDRAYVEAEWRAVLCSLINAIPGRVFERPHPHSLLGRWRSPPEWLLLAHRAGLATPAWAWTDEAAVPTVDPASDKGARVLVIGSETLSLSPLPHEAAAGCRRLAELAAISILEVTLVGDGRPTFAFANQLPDLRDGGDRAIAACAGMLEP